jgi:hypothetical protein
LKKHKDQEYIARNGCQQAGMFVGKSPRCKDVEIQHIQISRLWVTHMRWRKFKLPAIWWGMVTSLTSLIW